MNQSMFYSRKQINSECNDKEKRKVSSCGKK